MRLRVLAVIGKIAGRTGILQLYYWFADRIEFLARNRWKKAEVIEFCPPAAAKIAICSIFQPRGLSIFVRRQLRFLRRLGFEIALCVPHPLNDEDRALVASLCRYLILRDNFGSDIASYKDALLRIGFEQLKRYQRVLLVNDSLIFPFGDTTRFQQDYLSTQADVIGLFENVSVTRHIQSFFIDMSSRVICSPQSQAFWTSYKPYSSRYHAIYHGEIELSQAFLYKTADRIQMLYSPEKIYEAIAERIRSGDDPATVYALMSQVSLRKAPAKIPGEQPSELLLRQVRCLLERTNLSHSFALVIVRFMAAPFIKRDLCFRLSYEPAQIRKALTGHLDDELFEEALLAYSQRGTMLDLGAWDCILSFAGAK